MPGTAEIALPTTMRGRARHHTRRALPELRRMVKFGIVGGSGFVVNLAVFALVERLHTLHVISATVAFLAAVVNNFYWNRRWTFRGVGSAAIHDQARRFFLVSGAAFLFQLGILEALINIGVSPLISQAISVLAAMPLGFVGNRMWTFHEDGGLRERWAAHQARKQQQG
ncbi:MAG TPA: GtrA family protein [Solirubrobacteraceae bacterium]|nr:GtrA family protein [Solirubrobacteraceae bacterium]